MPVVLQHHVPVQCPLVGAQLLTLLAREVHRHILEGQRHHLLQKQVAAAPGPRPLGRWRPECGCHPGKQDLKKTQDLKAALAWASRNSPSEREDPHLDPFGGMKSLH